MLALESAHDPALARPYPFDVLGAQTQGMIGYWLVQALQNALPGRQVACLVSRTLVRRDDPAFAAPVQVRRPGLRRGAGPRPGREPALGDPPGRRPVAPGGALARARRTARPARHPTCCSAPGPSWSAPAAAACPSWSATAGPRGVEAVVDKDLTASAAGPRAGRGRAAAAHRRGGGPGRLRHPAGPADPPGHARRAAAARLPGRVDGAQDRGRRAASPRRPASRPPSGGSPTPQALLAGAGRNPHSAGNGSGPTG